MGQFQEPAYHVLLAEDEALTSMMLEDELVAAGYRVTSAPDGNAALAAARACPPKVAVLDLNMPGICGVALIRALRKMTPGLPILIITGDACMAGEALTLDDGGAKTRLLEKPFCFTHFVAEVEAMVAGVPLMPLRPRVVRSEVAAL
jgi:DNA-binding response OmpR family regulator